MYIYPRDEEEDLPRFIGIYPVDFLLQVILEEGLEWFRTDIKAKNLVFGNLCKGVLSSRYGQDKVDEIAKFIIENKIAIKQSFPLDDETSPSISINLSSGAEETRYSGMNDFAESVDVMGEDESVLERTEIGYTSIQDDILIGIHAVGGPDTTKYLYMLVIYILNAYREQLEEEGLHNVTFSSTDLSRLNEYLPSNMFSRFVTVKTLTFSLFEKGKVPIIHNIDLDVQVEEGE